MPWFQHHNNSTCNDCNQRFRITITNGLPGYSCGCNTVPQTSQGSCVPCGPNCTDMTNTSCAVFDGDDISCLISPIVTATGLNDVIISLANAICALQGDTGGTVVSFAAGNLSPLFTTTVTSPNETPTLSFTQIIQSENLFFASPNSTGPGVPTFRPIVFPDISAAIAQPDMQIVYGKSGTGIGSDTNAIWDYNNFNLFVGDLDSASSQISISLDNQLGTLQLESDLGAIGVIGSLGTATRVAANGVIVDSKFGHYMIGDQRNTGTYIDINGATGLISFNLATDSVFGTNAYFFPKGKATIAHSTFKDVSASGTVTWGLPDIVEGSTAIMGGTNTLIPYNNAGVYTESANLAWNQSGNLLMLGNGTTLAIKLGTTRRAGFSVLTAGTVTVANTTVTNNSIIFTNVSNLGTVSTPKALHTVITAGVGFTITSADVTDTSAVQWFIIETY